MIKKATKKKIVIEWVVKRDLWTMDLVRVEEELISNWARDWRFEVVVVLVIFDF